MVDIVHEFKLINTRTFGLPPDNGVYATHLATVMWGMREFVYFRIDSTGQTYIEEVILRPNYALGGKIIAKYKLIEDDDLWQDLAEFLREKGLTEMKLPYKNPFV
jgi:hypothetical protein